MLSFNPADPGAWRDRMVHGAAPESQRLDAASREFEAMLLRQYLSEALKPVTDSGAVLGANNPVYGYLVTDALATGLSDGGVFGFSNLLQAQVAGTPQKDHQDDDTTP